MLLLRWIRVSRQKIPDGYSGRIGQASIEIKNQMTGNRSRPTATVLQDASPLEQSQNRQIFVSPSGAKSQAA